jgi:hypothetical protein
MPVLHTSRIKEGEMPRYEMVLSSMAVILATMLALLCFPKGSIKEGALRLGRFLYEAVVAGPGLRRMGDGES